MYDFINISFVLSYVFYFQPLHNDDGKINIERHRGNQFVKRNKFTQLNTNTYTQEVSRICKSMQKFIEKNIEMYNKTCVAIGWPNK